jgi:predicted nuclease of predicted toxin-antitoxin system
MKLLLDTCVWGGACPVLEEAGNDVVWAGQWSTDPGDEEILNIAKAEGRVLVTLDKDFGEFAIVRSMPHSGILRLVDISATRQADIVLHIINRYSKDLMSGAIITVDQKKVRIRK